MKQKYINIYTSEFCSFYYLGFKSRYALLSEYDPMSVICVQCAICIVNKWPEITNWTHLLRNSLIDFDWFSTNLKVYCWLQNCIELSDNIKLQSNQDPPFCFTFNKRKYPERFFDSDFHLWNVSAWHAILLQHPVWCYIPMHSTVYRTCALPKSHM